MMNVKNTRFISQTAVYCHLSLCVGRVDRCVGRVGRCVGRVGRCVDRVGHCVGRCVDRTLSGCTPVQYYTAQYLDLEHCTSLQCNTV